MRMRDVEDEVETDLETWYRDGGYDVRYPEEDIDSVVDSNVPNSTNDLLSLAMDDNGLVFRVPELDGSSPLDLLRNNLYEHLHGVAWAKYVQLKEEYDDLPYCEQCGEKIFDGQESDEVETETYIHATCFSDWERDNPVAEFITDCEACGCGIFSNDDIIIEEDEDGTELYYHPVCSPSEKEISCGV